MNMDKFELLNMLQRSKRAAESPLSVDLTMTTKALIFGLIFMLLMMGVLICYLLSKYRYLRESRYERMRRADIGTRAINNKIVYDKQQFEIDREKLIETEKKLGGGHYGYVLEGLLQSVIPNTLETLPVAVKKSQKPEEIKLFFKEILIMNVIDKHPNVLALIGAITDPKQMLIVTELAYKDLKSYFESREYTFEDLMIRNEGATENYRTDFEINNDLLRLSTFDLISFAFQISNGMQHLASIPCVHRDLALRNIMITKTKTVRIADFGLARKHKLSKNYYKRQYDQALPESRMAPELFDTERYRNRFTEKTDIWTFALCLYELFTLGTDPEKQVNDLRNFLKKGERLPKPEHCRREV
uniref:Protein kinase domain-containing protein n=1 Tax=Caenorhabditis tropicalis TaxID=1561998 RepID=A0A1I7U9Q5_9PELO